MKHEIEITRLSDGAVIPTSQIQVSIDANSWARAWSATLIGQDALAMALPSEAGEPVTLEATVNGHPWQLVVEDWTEDRAFGSRTPRISGRGLSAWLGTPYEPAASGTLENARTLAQAMEEMLPLGSGWTISWAPGTPDWPLPSGTWNWSNQSPIQAIHDAAQGVGLVVVPDMVAKVLTVQPRYPVPPWQYADTTDADMIALGLRLFEVPDSAILSLTRRQAVPTQANAVYVYGGSSGIIARCWRTGTAGDRLAPTVQDDRITDVDGARLLGTRLLAAQAQQPDVRSITTTLGGIFPLGNIGDLLSLDGGVRGIINSVSISAGSGTVRATYTIGEDTPNVWSMWRRLLPGSPLLLGTVLSIHGDGTRTVALVGGGTQRVRGDGAVDDQVWIRSGRIEGQAPSLPSYDIEVF